MIQPKSDKYREHVLEQLQHVNRLLPRYATGDFSELIPLPESENEFTELYTGLNLMVEDLQGLLQEQKDTIERLKQTDEKLQVTLNRLTDEKNLSETVINSLPGVFYMFNPKGKFVNWNENFEQVTENSKSEVAKSSPLDYFTGETKKRIAAKILRVFTKGEASVEGELVSKSGKHIPYFFTGIRAKINKKYYLLGVGIDISDQKALENKLKRSNEDLQEFAYAVSHDLQEPLRKIKNYIDLFAQKYQDNLDEKATKYIRYITSGADRMRTLILDILSLSRISTHGKTPEKQKLDDILFDAKQNLEVSITETGAVITNDSLPKVPVDKIQITQLFQNLLGNAIKFQSNQIPSIHISSKELNGNWVIGVKDNGIGIETEYLNRIFSVFQRLHSRDEYEGTGIGLAICKKIVERHGGTIWAESKPDTGTKFVFTLPK